MQTVSLHQVLVSVWCSLAQFAAWLSGCASALQRKLVFSSQLHAQQTYVPGGDTTRHTASCSDSLQSTHQRLQVTAHATAATNAASVRKAAFIQQYGSLYGYSGRIDALRREEFARLGSKVYVDHAGATLYSETQMQAVMQDYMVNMYSNPHSQHAGFGERGSADAEADARAMTLAMCNASPAEYECIFTSGATAALKLVADSFPWAAGSQFAYTLDNHNSVLGMREVAMKGGASAIAVTASHTGTGDWDLQQASEVMAAAATSAVPAAGASDGGDGEGGAPGCMFAFPVESNFNGARLDLSLVQQVQQQGLMGHRGRWRVLLDAAKACATAPPDLSRYPADFMVLSFYKIFGYPTGLGALIVRKDALQLLQPTYFGGGTVEVSVADARFHRKRKGAAGFEDGTTSYLAYAALRHGFAQIQKLGGFHNIQLHTDSLTRYLTSQLTNLRHANGSPGCVLYGSGSTSRHGRNGTSQGPVVAFNLLRRDGLFVGYREVEKMAGLCSIYLRTGCFCNPGACALHLGLSAGQLKRNFEAGHVCWDDNDVIDGRPTGAVRVSFGYMSTFEDADAVLRFIAQYFVEGSSGYPEAPPAQLCSLGRARASPEQQRPPHEPASAATAASPATVIVAADSPCAGGPIIEASTSQPSSSGTQASVVSHLSENTLETRNAHIHPQAVSGTSTPDMLEGQPCRVQPLDAASEDRPSASTPMQAISQEHTSQPQPSNAADVAAALLDRQLSSRPDQVSTSAASQPAQQPAAAREVASNGTLGACLATDADQPQRPVLQAIWVYPIKSCAGCSVGAWPLGPNGLLYDREWALVDEAGDALKQKKVPKMTAIMPSIDLQTGVMTVAATCMPTALQIPLPRSQTYPAPAGNGGHEGLQGESGGALPGTVRHVRICADNVCSLQAATVAGDSLVASTWFSEALGVRCHLVQQQPGSRSAVPRHLLRKGLAEPAAPQPGLEQHEGDNRNSSIGFANEGQFLLTSATSMADVNARLAAKDLHLHIDAARYRPNLVVAGPSLQPYAEDAWDTLAIGGLRFRVEGPCARCEMVCMDQSKGSQTGPEPLLTLASYRRRRGRIHFGVLLSHLGDSADASSAAEMECVAECGSWDQEALESESDGPVLSVGMSVCV